MKRPTMVDIARRAGVTKSAVSFALNGRPGVSEATRARVLAIADELGWQPNSAARALSDGRAGAFGLVVDRPARSLGIEPFFMQLVSGIQGELSEDGTSLLFTVAPDADAEMATYRAWWAQRKVDGVFLVDLRVDDPRVRALEELRLPAVVIGSPAASGGLSAVWSDDAAGVRTAVAHLADLGHRSIAHVTGPAVLRHTLIRTEAFTAATAERGVTGRSVEADYSGERGFAATRALLEGAERPTAILYDNDVMAVSGLSAAQTLGVRVPEDVSLVAWDDSPLCELVHPGLTALRRDIAAYGALAARQLRDVATGHRVEHRHGPDPTLTVRDSTAAPSRDTAPL
ncbi:LacI family DNA-binding transcriptional regulator [Streptomyces sp. DH37]|uniref:LacI family DNA-binding transcriptional regulator n=1 Tax=Streptomyces sp. DH37 TaxID=3040122 RepID=UPI00244370A6|nr:LacI family DNA-binding transcriptional regulator [Streptomyces sp. DH37]MDG9705025.1 LacI family DNA-binding transcriptional regulator [Streptomyces sp. DH37]